MNRLEEIKAVFDSQGLVTNADIAALVAAVEAALNMPGEVVECGYPLDSEWAYGYTAALVDVRAVIRQALGEGEK